MSSYTEGSVHQLADALEKNGWTAEDVTKLKQFSNLKGVKDILNEEAEITYPDRTWSEQNGIISFYVASDGTSGEGWITRLTRKGFYINEHVKSMLRSRHFQPTIGAVTEIALIKRMMFEDIEETTKRVNNEVDRCNLVELKLTIETACLAREKFRSREMESMGLHYIIVMHEPIEDSDGTKLFLAIHREGGLTTYYHEGPKIEFVNGRGFAFLAAQQAGFKS